MVVKIIKPEMATEVTKKHKGQVLEEKQEFHEGDPMLIDKEAGLSMVTVGCGFTRNLGDFNSCRVYVEIGTECSKGSEDTVYEQLLKNVSDKLEALSEETGVS